MRASGILMHISSLPSPYGIGTMGKAAYAFVDFLKAAKQTYWQILPLGPTSLGDSPYQSFSSHAGNPYFIDLDMLCDAGFLQPNEVRTRNWGVSPAKVDYATLYENRFHVLRIAFARFCDAPKPGYRSFCRREAGWLDDYALFMALKQAHGDVTWHDWPTAYRQRDAKAIQSFAKAHEQDITFWKFLQFQFDQQWSALKAYANQNGIRVIGDLPIYVADDSADVWANPDLFDLDADLCPNLVAGCPPDGFTKTGQLWGNPVYNWKEMKRQHYRWWIDRLRKSLALCDLVRIDHFRGLESYYALPHGAKTAEHGIWKKGPGRDLFRAIHAALGDVDLIAENLGLLTPAVRKLHLDTGYPGMRVLQFAFGAHDVHNENLPHNIEPNNIVYAGTHDNPTIAQWIDGLSEQDRVFCLEYMHRSDTVDFIWDFIQMVHATRGEVSIITMQDYLELGAEARMNLPATIGGNWEWRAKPGECSRALAKKIAHVTKLYERCQHLI